MSTTSPLGRIVVVGAGLAGLRAAERLRELGFNDEIMIVGAEPLAPYHRPGLSKQLLTGVVRPDDLWLSAYRELGARWRLGSTALRLQPHRRIVHLPGGEEVGYDGLIIATGVDARRLPDVPHHDPRVFVVRTLPDALALERAVSATRGRIAIVGGGFTGCEIAASLRSLNREVTIIGRSRTLLGNVLGEQLGNWLTELHRHAGVDLALGGSVQQWLPRSTGVELHLSDGRTLLAACVVVTTGTVPATAWLRDSGLTLDDGVVCDATCHAQGAADVVAAGDVAQWPNLRYDDVPRRVEHWLNAVEMGRAAAENLLAGHEAAVPFTPLPRFWSEQFGVRIQAAGVPKLGAATTNLSSPDGSRVVGYLRNNRLVGVVGLNCPTTMRNWTEYLHRHTPVPWHRQPPAADRDDTVPVPRARIPLAADLTQPVARDLLEATTRHPNDNKYPLELIHGGKQ